MTTGEDDPWAEAARAIVKMTPEEKEALGARMRKAAHDAREAQKRKEREPPVTPTGTCAVCGGLVKGEHTHGLRPGIDHRAVPCGPASKQYFGWTFQGYHCVDCGLVYKFPPKPKAASPTG